MVRETLRDRGARRFAGESFDPPMKRLGASMGSQSHASARRMPVPTTRYPGWEARVVCVAPRSPFAEAFRDLALRLRQQLAREEGTSILVTSGLPGEGKTV